MRLRVLPLLATSTAAVLAAGVVPALAAPAAPTATPPATAAIPDSSAYGTYFANTPQRIFDTRSAGNSRLGQGRSVTVAVAKNGVTPNAVVVNLTAVNPSTAGYLTAYPAGQALPRTSSINFAGGRTTANLVTVPVASNGTFVVYNGLGTTDLIVDQLGVYTGATTTPAGRGGGFQPTDPQRLLDTRSDGGGQLPGGFYLTVPVQYAPTGNGEPIAALAVNITVTNARSSGYVTAWDGADGNPPRASTLNFTAGTTVANSAIVPTSQCPATTTQGCAQPNVAQIGIVNGSGQPIDLIVDVVGFYDNGSIAAPIRYVPLSSPSRIVDSRSNLGVRKLGPGATQTFTTPQSVAVPGVVGLDANVTVVKPTTSTYLTLWPAVDVPRPRTSTVNAGSGQVVSNHVIQELSPDHRANVYNFNGNSDVVVDVSGTFQRIADAAARNAPTRAELTVVRSTPTRQAAAR